MLSWSEQHLVAPCRLACDHRCQQGKHTMQSERFGELLDIARSVDTALTRVRAPVAAQAQTRCTEGLPAVAQQEARQCAAAQGGAQAPPEA